MQLRQGDLYALPVTRDSSDLAIMHQVLHYLEDPARALKEAARALFAGRTPRRRRLRARMTRRRCATTMRIAASASRMRRFPSSCAAPASRWSCIGTSQPDAREGAKLTVSLWVARDPRIIADVVPSRAVEAA